MPKPSHCNCIRLQSIWQQKQVADLSTPESSRNSPKGNVPWNKGMKGIAFGGHETRFKKGTVPPNHKEVGAERIDEDGYTYIKIAEHTRWVLKHRHIYEQHHGKLEPHMIVTFRDKNISNFEIENLEAITKVENMERNRITKYPQTIQQAVKTLNKLWHAIKSKT